MKVPAVAGLSLMLACVCAACKEDGLGDAEVGKMALVAGHYDTAITLFDTALDKGLDQRDSALAYEMRGVAFAGKGMLDQALKDYDEALRRWPDQAEAHLNRGNALAQKGLYRRAVADYDEALRAEPGMVGAYIGRSVVRSDWGEYEKALADSDAALRLDPANLKALRNRAFTRYRMGLFDEALHEYGHVVELYPHDSYARASRGLLLARMGRYDDAFADFDEAIRLDPADEFGYSARGSIRYITGRFPAAAEDLAHARALAPKDAYAIAWHCLALARLSAGGCGSPQQAPPQLADHDWPDALVEFLAGRELREQVEAAEAAPEPVVQKSRECDAFAFFGEHELIAGHVDAAAELFGKAGTVCGQTDRSGMLAEVELARMVKKRT